ncbi:MAG: hypothetical protein GEV11_27700 [Streptosporangiales bacterium]|nr:hypothetical protein [Streptosporangiales bacterium]
MGRHRKPRRRLTGATATFVAVGVSLPCLAGAAALASTLDGSPPGARPGGPPAGSPPAAAKRTGAAEPSGTSGAKKTPDAKKGGEESPSPRAAMPDMPNKIRLAPYVAGRPASTPDLTEVADRIKVNDLMLGRVMGGDGCVAAWLGDLPLGNASLDERIDDLRGDGGHPIISFGGGGTDLADVCTNVDDLAERYGYVIQRYDLEYVDFELDARALRGTAGLERRARAIATEQREAADADRRLVVSLTLPATSEGLTADAQEAVRTFDRNGVDVGLVNLVTGELGDRESAGRPGEAADLAIGAAEAAVPQLDAIFPGDAADARRRLGLTSVIGDNAATGAVFYLEDAERLVDWAKENEVGRLSYRSVGRDRECGKTDGVTGSAGAPVAGVDAAPCSGLEQEPDAFAKTFHGFLDD